ncbi:hypothetical protein D9615_003480 [Tricholomella constricta]|uniref:Uncharacterized protein n=1 Tax=Tricholomella constricta TaxID=117010 RepID=A0A8H5M878_9AGAR|nr:hypothetical protein D9615_003480 [Tricholomella constricta]
MSQQTPLPAKIVTMVAIPSLFLRNDGEWHLEWQCVDFLSPEPARIGDIIVILAREAGRKGELFQTFVVIDGILPSGRLEWAHLNVSDLPMESTSVRIPTQFLLLDGQNFIKHIRGARVSHPYKYLGCKSVITSSHYSRSKLATLTKLKDSNKRPPDGSPTRIEGDQPRLAQKPRRDSNLGSVFPPTFDPMMSQDDDPFGDALTSPPINQPFEDGFPPLPPPGANNQLPNSRPTSKGPRAQTSRTPLPESPTPQPRNPMQVISSPTPPPNDQQGTPTPRASSLDSLQFLHDANLPWATIVEEGLEKNDKGLVCNPVPPGGFPVVHLRYAPSYNLTSDILWRWQNKPGPKVWFRTYDGNYDPQASDTVALIRKLIGKVVDAEEAVIAPPVRMNIINGRIQPPFHFLIWNISQYAADVLENRYVIATEDITVFVVPYDPPIPFFIMSLCDLTYPLTPRSHEAAADFVRSILSRNPEVAHFLHDNLTAPQDAGAVNEAFRSIFAKGFTVQRLSTPDGLRTKFGPQVVWNIYFGKPLSLSLADYYSLINMIRNLSYISDDYGIGRPLKGDSAFQCAGCGSAPSDKRSPPNPAQTHPTAPPPPPPTREATAAEADPAAGAEACVDAAGE